jgi:hypothetical protein
MRYFRSAFGQAIGGMIESIMFGPGAIEEQVRIVIRQIASCQLVGPPSRRSVLAERRGLPRTWQTPSRIPLR